MFAPDPHPDTPAPGCPEVLAAAPSHSATPPLGHSATSPRSDRELLAALRDPGVLATIDPAEYAAWIERPEIQKAIAAQDDLEDRRERLQAAAHRAECLEDNRLARQRLRAVLDATRDLTDEAQRTDHRRAATALGRLSDLRPTRRAHLNATRPRAAPAPSPSHRITVSPSQAPPPPTPPPQASPVQPSHTFPGLDTTVAAFLAAVGSPDGLTKAAELVANHRSAEICPHNLMEWLERQTAPLRGAQLRPGRTVHHDHYDAVEQYIHAVHRDGATTWIIECVLERDPDMNPTRWAIARVNPDTS